MENFIIDQYVYWEKKEQFLLDSDLDSQWIAYVIEDGSCEFTIDGQTGIARKGDFLVCPPYFLFHREIREKLTFHFFRFSLESGSFSPKMSYPLEIKNKARVLSSAELLREIAYDSTPFYNDYRENLFKDILMLSYFEKHDVTISGLGIEYKDPIISKIIFYLSNLSEDELSINEIAQRLCIHPSYLSRKFKKVTKYSPIEYRNRLRIRRAQKLLIETDYTLEKIAELCGISNGFYLSRIFSKHLGVCPYQYRRNHQI